LPATVANVASSSSSSVMPNAALSTTVHVDQETVSPSAAPSSWRFAMAAATVISLLIGQARQILLQIRARRLALADLHLHIAPRPLRSTIEADAIIDADVGIEQGLLGEGCEPRCALDGCSLKRAGLVAEAACIGFAKVRNALGKRINLLGTGIHFQGSAATTDADRTLTRLR
jgi:hypothetical protein